MSCQVFLTLCYPIPQTTIRTFVMTRNIKLAICLAAFLGLFTGLFGALFGGVSAHYTSAQTRNVDYRRDIEPIFRASCYQCHSEKKAAGRLRLDDRQSAMKGGVSGPAIVPGNSRDSRLMQRIMGIGDQARMPFGKDPLKP